MRFANVAQLAIMGMAAMTAAHPGGSHEGLSASQLVAKRSAYLNAQRSLSKCADKLESSGFNRRAAERRRATVELQRRALKDKKRHVERDEESVLNTSHNQTDSGITASTDESVIFASNGTCVINPVSEFGPFWVKGEYVRKDIREDQPGIPVTIDGQFIDAETCEPIEGLYWDICNNGNGDDQSNIHTTFLRGIQQTDSEGVVQFNTLFPGHYSGRATHTHVIAHLNATPLPNNTLSGGSVAYVGHMFWDQDLIYEVEATYPYNTNTIAITTNEDDSIFPNEAATIDPVFNYVYVGDSLDDGLFAWITVAINTTASYTESYSFELTEDGGGAVDAASDIGGTGGAGGFGNGTAPSGALPTGAAPSGAAPSAASTEISSTAASSETSAASVEACY